jgi:hypothetical protein
MNWKGCGSGRDLIRGRVYYPDIRLEGLKNTTKNLTQDQVIRKI